MRKVLAMMVLVLFTTLINLSRPDVSYAKLLPRHRSSGGSSSAPISTRSYAGVSISPKFLPARNGLRVSFGSLQNAKKVDYMLTYETNGKPEGVSGTVRPSEGNSTTRDLQFGTCSSGTCVKHKGIKNMQLTVTSELTSGKTSIKKYSIRV